MSTNPHGYVSKFSGKSSQNGEGYYYSKGGIKIWNLALWGMY